MNFNLLSTEIATALFGSVLLILSLVTGKDARRGLGHATLAGLLVLLLITFTQYGINSGGFSGTWILDDYAVFMKQVFIIAAILVVFAGKSYVEDFTGNCNEFYVLMVFALLGMMGMASAGDLITLYVSLETMTISFYILVAYNLTSGKSAEAGLKYLILGALSSAVILYGMSLVYGAAGTTLFAKMPPVSVASPVLLLGAVMLVAGFGFKIAAVPFHMWSPDIYEGAPTPVTAFLAVASKAAGFAAMLRVFLGGTPVAPDNWLGIIAVLAAITMIIGNLVAIPQTGIKRMLAYSSIAQAGYILVGLMAADPAGVNGVLFYSMIYAVANVGAFAVVIAVERATGSDEIAVFGGLWQRQPLLASVMTVCLLSLAGIPPMAGFVGKFLLFSAIMDQGIYWPAFIGFVMSMISVYYYLRVALVIWRDEPKDPAPIAVESGMRLAVMAALAVTVVLGVYPAVLSDLSLAAAKSFFGM
ncbi:MAG: NADH-quinone oxidoreductase subunit N [Negativicutes bacterium]|nr:NADH-quinone oxidoreductase subunit N [Negativicutes bacterium]